MSLELIFYYYAFLDKDNNKPQLSPEEKRRRDKRTPRIALWKYVQSSFLYLYNSGNEQALLNCCACDHKTFRILLGMFAPVFNKYTFDDKTGQIREVSLTKTGKPKGRKREIDAIGCLGLVLYWFRTRGSCARATPMAFGLTATPLYKWLRFSRRILLFVLQHHPKARVILPTQQEVDNYAKAIAEKYPVLGNQKVWGAADGLKVPLQKSANWSIQNQYYNGWAGYTYVNSVFVFAPDGRIRMCTLNAPGTWHDSTMADYGIYEKMEDVYNQFQGKLVVDSAFKLQDKRFLIKSAQQDPIGDPIGVRINRAATAVRQLSEHGMRMIQGQFPRLKDRLQLEEFGERKVTMNLMVLLYNFQTGSVGINHILNSYMSNTPGFCSFYNHTITETANNIFN